MTAGANFRFRLFVAGRSRNSTLALDNLHHICLLHLPDRHSIEVVDVLTESRRALDEGIVVTPTLVRLVPAPVCRIIGNLSQTDVVLTTLGLIEYRP